MSEENQKNAIVEALKLLAKMSAELFRSYRKEGLSIKESAALTVAVLNSQSESALESSSPNPLAGLEGLDSED